MKCVMVGRRKQPRLRIDNDYYNVKVYTPEGKRTQVSFGHIDDRSEADVRAVFARWLELYTIYLLEEVQEAMKVAKLLSRS